MKGKYNRFTGLLKILPLIRMKQSGLPAIAVAGSCGSISLERGTHSLRKHKKEVVKEVPKAAPVALPKPEPVKRSVAVQEPPKRLTVKDFVNSHLADK